jgi:16S rRNA (adenine1518-N6/adenine1519-N6)-dimethyltransferase
MLDRSHRARKRFGQNFLVDTNMISRIARAIGARKADNIVEIGPGQGALTAFLFEDCEHISAVELDRDLIPILLDKFSRKSFDLHEGDALKFDFSELSRTRGGPVRVVGNLPYNISTPLIFHLLRARECIHDMHFMLQKEVVERLAALPGDKTYGRLGVMAQYYCAIEHLFDVPPDCFHPAPKVMSAIVRLVPHAELPYKAQDSKLLANIVQLAFGQRRKTLRNGLKPLISQIDAEHESLPVDLSLRAERLSVKQFVELSNAFSELGIE